MEVGVAQPGKKARGALSAFSRELGSVRWIFLPLGIFALLAVGIHAAADSVCDRLLWVADRFAEGFDHAMAHFDLTADLVGAFSFSARTHVARGLALVWELAADVVLALPAFNFEEQTSFRLRDQLRRAVAKPTTLRWTRPLETFAFALAGACAVARMVQSSLYLGLESLLGRGASPAARFAALLALAAIAICLGARALRHAIERSDSRSELEARTPATRLTVGLLGSMIALPLALAAVVDASPLLSFFRGP